MKFTRVAVVLSALLIVSAVAHADGLKIGAISFQKALNDVEQGKRAKAALKIDFETKQKKLDLQQEELKKLKEEIETKRDSMTKDALLAKEKSFQEKFMTLQQNIQQFRAELGDREGRMAAKIIENLRSVMQEIGASGDYDLVVEVSQDAVVYAKSREDLTDKAIAAYNKKFTGELKY